MTTTDRIIGALDTSARSTRDIATRAGLPFAQVACALQALAVGPIRGIATARGKELGRLSAIKPAVRKSYYRAHLGRPLWVRGAVS